MSIAIDATTRTKISRLLDGLCEGLYEREQSVKLALLSAVAGRASSCWGLPAWAKA